MSYRLSLNQQEEENYMKSFGKFGMILAKIMEIFFWIGAVSMIVLFILCLAKPGALEYIEQNGVDGMEGGFTSISTLGLSVSSIPANGIVTILLWYPPFAAVLLGLMAMIFRNLYLILKKLHADKKESFSEENSPFQPDIVRMIRAIGIFALSIPLVELVANEILFLVFRMNNLEVELGGFNLSMLAFGMVVLYLSSIFSYGARLQKETEGLV